MLLFYFAHQMRIGYLVAGNTFCSLGLRGMWNQTGGTRGDSCSLVAATSNLVESKQTGWSQDCAFTGQSTCWWYRLKQTGHCGLACPEVIVQSCRSMISQLRVRS